MLLMHQNMVFNWFIVVGRMDLPPMSQTQIPGICEYVMLLGHREWGDVIKIQDLKIRRLFWII